MSLPKICIYGAGSMGGYIGAALALAEAAEVTLVARGDHLSALRTNGIALIDESGARRSARCRVVASGAEAGPQDYVFITLKAPSAAAAVPDLRQMLRADTAVVTAQNGMPWWYFHKLAGPWEGRRLASIDPGDVLWNGIGPERAIGCVLWGAAELVEPGVVRLRHANRMPLGEPDGTLSIRAERLSKTMALAGLDAPVVPKIRDELWAKLWGNTSFNPVSALTGATLEELATDPDSREPIRLIMEESRAVGEKLGVRFGMSVEARIAAAKAVGAHKTSTLQDLEKGRPMELDALVGAVCELGRMVEVPTPVTDIVFSLTRQRARLAGSYPRA
jgi:2-dehydropantoate 2-reductase